MFDALEMLKTTSSYNGDEADGVIAVTVVATRESPVLYIVTITPSEPLLVSIRECWHIKVILVN